MRLFVISCPAKCPFRKGARQNACSRQIARTLWSQLGRSRVDTSKGYLLANMKAPRLDADDGVGALLLLSTLRKSVEAMGGNLSLVAEFPDREPVVLSGIAEVEP